MHCDAEVVKFKDLIRETIVLGFVMRNADDWFPSLSLPTGKYEMLKTNANHFSFRLFQL